LEGRSKEVAADEGDGRVVELLASEELEFTTEGNRGSAGGSNIAAADFSAIFPSIPSAEGKGERGGIWQSVSFNSGRETREG
jgi:adenylosuccinate synthase